MSLYEELVTLLPRERVRRDEPMSRHTSFKVGGNADVFCEPSCAEELARALKAAKQAGAPFTVIGNGSNLLVRDGGIRGLVIRLGDSFSAISVHGQELSVQAGAALAKLAAAAQEHALTGLEFASGIPGTVGGGLFMNAGAYDGSLSDVCTGARLLKLDTMEEAVFSASELRLGYRSSVLQQGDLICLEAFFRLEKGDAAAIRAKMDELNRRRREKQPLNYPSAGSTFKRPQGHFAGALIQQAGLKGLTVGGAQVSEKHAGFIINLGGATARDIIELIEKVKAQVYETSGVMLEPEVRITGEG
ncbi:MAG: UDP-N-acetylmuramate dehydrogenase [Clostridiales bacterium]|nr:UDP-N-acetylmuramate dehydrogenase [Clostridiales bacterium]